MNIKKIKRLAADMKEKTVETRRYLHAHPELSWRETETSLYVERRLREYGYENIRRGFGDAASGVTADLSGSSGPRFALRADLDALPIHEENGAPYRSSVDGVMHACGHDGHISILLAAAEILSLMKEEMPGCIRLIFQPAEEIGSPSGAAVMIDEGALEDVDAIGGLHLWSFVESGKVQWKNGPVMASSDRWNVVFTGKGGHGAAPHTAIDPTVAAAAFLCAIQTITSREIDPIEPAVVSLGKIEAGDAFNIIPDRVNMAGTLRSFDSGIRASMEARLRRLAGGIAAAYRCEAETSVTHMIPSVVNHAGITKILREAAEAVVGAENTEESPRLMISEDFSMYQERVPGTFFFVGAGNPAKGADNPHHSPRFEIDEDALETGVAMMAAFAFSAVEKLK
ncbi:MAG: amidohydrolase [Synergistaceae bacterium]|jgi:amidohydrolase|nr:amidohydrolase [Synergistaceae bacterium]